MLVPRTDEKAGDGTLPTNAARNKPATTNVSTAGGSTRGGALHDSVFGTARCRSMIETMDHQMARTVSGWIGRQILRGAIGGIFDGQS